MEVSEKSQKSLIARLRAESLLSSLYKGEKFPLFDKWFAKAHHPELVEEEGFCNLF